MHKWALLRGPLTDLVDCFRLVISFVEDIELQILGVYKTSSDPGCLTTKD